MLEHDEIAFTGLVLHKLLELHTKRVKQVTRARRHLLLREEPDPAETRDNARALGSRRELAQCIDTFDQGTIKRMSRRSELFVLRGQFYDK